jgi:hypothetical protein
MTFKILDSNEFKQITLSIERDLQNNPDLSWVNVCTYTRKAYLMGVINALSSISSEGDINSYSVQAIMKTLYSDSALDKLIANEISEMN